MPIRHHAAALAFALIAPAALVAQRAAVPAHLSPVVAPAVRLAVADSVAATLERSYADPDAARTIATHVRARSRDGAYKLIRTSAYFADAITRDLQAIAADERLSLEHVATDAPRLVPAVGDGALRRIDVGHGFVLVTSVRTVTAARADADRR